MWPTKEQRAAFEEADIAAVRVLRKRDSTSYMEFISLWRAVILNALHDAFVLKAGTCNSGLDEISFSEQLGILEWLFTPNSDFLAVCELAGIDPMNVRKMAIELETLPRDEAKRRVGPLLPCSTARSRQSSRDG